jgi:XRE family transcriptional regulator, aerobic/anaerobic benzoate catabolism transcriptional regulator
MYYTAFVRTVVASHSPIESKLAPSSPPQLSGEQFLLSLGARVRELRNRRGMTRRTLAQESDVSERHLAQLESGEGNISILLLRRIAAVLSVSLEELFAANHHDHPDDDPGSSHKRNILRFIERLPSHRLEEAAARLMRDFGAEQNLRLARIALIGLRGAGKSTLGSKLAAERNVPFIELDHEIEKDTGMPLAEIFSLYGQSGYRAIEKRTLERVLRANDSAVISVGGGIVSEKETYDYLLAHCYTIWLKAQPEEHMSRVIAQGDLRVMAGNDRAMEDLRGILESREPLYRKADATVDTSNESVDASFTKLKAALEAASQ